MRGVGPTQVVAAPRAWLATPWRARERGRLRRPHHRRARSSTSAPQLGPKLTGCRSTPHALGALSNSPTSPRAPTGLLVGPEPCHGPAKAVRPLPRLCRFRPQLGLIDRVGAGGLDRQVRRINFGLPYHCLSGRDRGLTMRVEALRLPILHEETGSVGVICEPFQRKVACRGRPSRACRGHATLRLR